jgi:hypothetical protein
MTIKANSTMKPSTHRTHRHCITRLTTAPADAYEGAVALGAAKAKAVSQR